MNYKDSFREYLGKNGLKVTQQREVILDEFLAAGSHLSTEELYRSIREKYPHIGYATVHRTLKLLAESGLAAPRHFGDGHTRYECSNEEQHHDHLICTICGAIIEFENPGIERLQEQVAAKHGFVIEQHRLEIYGRCSSCLAGKGKKEKK
ncbi:MAG: transcriptional repressor [Desulfuromonadales bacterium]|nr:transcriptional repressor [Desulfuromonadales bacterium]